MFKFIENFIKKLGEENDKSFGNGKLDCCGLNKTQPVKVQETKNTNKK
ncbi:MAG: hypothetical protein K0Q97_2428 [Bacillota bacterium]|nr:hypothetical protein [Bacillota bacterium]